MDIDSFFSDDGSVNESVVVEELRKQIQQISSPEDTDEFKRELNDQISSLICSVTSFLIEKRMHDVLSEFVRIVLDNIDSIGMQMVSLPINTILQMMELAGKDFHAEKRSRPKQDKRSVILDAAMMVFSQKGFHNAHVDEIAELAGIAKGTVYRYFSSKDDILRDLVIEKIALVGRGLSEIFRRGRDILELIKEAIAYYVDFCEQNKDLYRILIHTPWLLSDVNKHFYDDIISHLPMIKRRIYAQTLRGRIKATNFYTVFYGILGFVDGVVHKWLNDDCEYSLKDEVPVIIEVIFYGFVGEDLRGEILSSKDAV
ncbi:MAG: TetR/AcrR family transcriptional regulator [Spirochaetota bacterium]|nr:TetR/AcrR family transcriptional regulator [Spirochaetota bacterium]